MRDQSKMALDAAKKKYGKGFQHLGEELQYAVVSRELISIVLSQHTDNSMVVELKQIIREAFTALDPNNSEGI